VKQGQTEVRSFRLGAELLRALEEEAAKLRMSVNALVSRLVTTFVEYERYARGFGLVRLPAPVLRYLLEQAPDEAVIRAAKLAGQEVPEALIRAKLGPMSPQAALAHLRELGPFSGLYEYSEGARGQSRTIALTHGLGLKGSLFIAHYAQALLEGAGLQAIFSIGEHAVLLELREQ